MASTTAAKTKPSINDWTGLGGRKSLEQVSKLFNIVYVAGPMTGYENFNFPAFDQGRDYVNSIEKGRKPKVPLAAVSPADMDRAHGFDEVAASQTPVGAKVSDSFFHDCMRRDMELVSRAHAIMLMAGWQASTGANFELVFARACGVKVWLATYDDEGNVNGHVEAPEWLRSPKIYGDDGNPGGEVAPGLSHTSTTLTESLSTKGKTLLGQEVDQALSEPPAVPESFETRTVLEEANHLIFGPRNADYGHPIEDFTRTGKVWGALIGDLKDGEPVPPEIVGLCMVGVKLSREVNKHKRDNLVDIAGYSGTVEMIAEYKANLETVDECVFDDGFVPNPVGFTPPRSTGIAHPIP